MKHRFEAIDAVNFVENGVIVWRDKIVKLPGGARIYYTFDAGNESAMPDSISFAIEKNGFDTFNLRVCEAVLDFLENIENKTVSELLTFLNEFSLAK